VRLEQACTVRRRTPRQDNRREPSGHKTSGVTLGDRNTNARKRGPRGERFLLAVEALHKPVHNLVHQMVAGITLVSNAEPALRLGQRFETKGIVCHLAHHHRSGRALVGPDQVPGGPSGAMPPRSLYWASAARLSESIGFPLPRSGTPAWPLLSAALTFALSEVIRGMGTMKFTRPPARGPISEGK
jgi:hypothetical protein